MAAAHQPHPFGGVQPRGVMDDVADPRATRVDQHLGVDHLAPAIRAMLYRDRPAIGAAVGRDDFGPGHDTRAAQFGVAGVQHHKAGVFDPAIGVFKSLLEPILQRRPFGRTAQRKAACGGQDFSPAEIVIEEQAQPDQPRRAAAPHPRHEQPQQLRGRRVALEPHVAVIGQHETHRPRDMRHRLQQHLALGQRMAHEADLEILKVTQPAVEQLGRSRRGRRGQIVHLGQGHAQPPACRVARDPGAVNATTEDE